MQGGCRRESTYGVLVGSKRVGKTGSDRTVPVVREIQKSGLAPGEDFRSIQLIQQHCVRQGFAVGSLEGD